MKQDDLMSLNINNCISPKTEVGMNISKSKSYSISTFKIAYVEYVSEKKLIVIAIH